MSQSHSIERLRGAPQTDGLGVLPVTAVLLVGALALGLALTFALVLAGVLPGSAELGPLFTT
jgi:hypothetical protein